MQQKMTIKQDYRKSFNEALKLVELTGQDLKTFYAKALKEVNKTVAAFKLKIDKGLLSDLDNRKYERVVKLQAEIETTLKDLFKVRGNIIKNGYVQEYTESFYKVGFAIERDVNMTLLSGENYDYSLNFTQLNPGYVKTTFDVPIGGMVFKQRSDLDLKRLQFKIQGIIERAMQDGLSTKQVAKELKGIDIAFSESFKKALTVARTELLRGYSYGQEDAINQSKYVGVDGDNVWDATLDSRTRPSHAYMDQKKSDKDGFFYVPGPRGREKTKGPRMPGLSAANTVNCRCRKIYLPFGVEPSRRGGRLPDGDWSTKFEDKDWQAWAKDQQKSGTIDEQTAHKLKVVKKLTLEEKN